MTNQLRLNKRILLVFCLLSVFAFSWVAIAREQEPAKPKEESSPSELHRAAHDGKLDALRLSLSQGMNPDARDRAGRTPLMDAVKTGEIEAMRLLITFGAGVNTRSSSGRTPL